MVCKEEKAENKLKLVYEQAKRYKLMIVLQKPLSFGAAVLGAEFGDNESFVESMKFLRSTECLRAKIPERHLQ